LTDGGKKDIKARVRAAQLKAGLAVNRELVLLYWHIGREILARQKQEGWGAKVIDRLSRDLAHEFPDMRGFSPRNLLFMRAFADGYADETIVKQLVSLLPWGHDVWATANCAGGACTNAVGHNIRVH
jgi:predicted nuclease of restriction endonuclease-like (RecB) superfamily